MNELPKARAAHGKAVEGCNYKYRRIPQNKPNTINSHSQLAAYKFISTHSIQINMRSFIVLALSALAVAAPQPQRK